MHAISIPQKFQIDIFRKKKSLSYLCWIYKVLFPVLILSAKLCCRVLDCPRCDICPCSRCITLFKWNPLTLRIETVSGSPPGVYISLCRGGFQLEKIYTPASCIHHCLYHVQFLFDALVKTCFVSFKQHSTVSKHYVSMKVSMMNMSEFWDNVLAKLRREKYFTTVR